MTIYILIDEPPSDWGPTIIQGIFLGQSNGTRKLHELKGQDPYKWQYLRLTGYKVEDYPK